MKYFLKSINLLCSFLIYNKINRNNFKKFLNCLIFCHINKIKIFVYGIGRSGLIAKMFAMRLMHLNYLVYIIGDVTTPSITSNDLIIIISNSGETFSLINIVNKCKDNINCKIILVTSSVNSSLSKLIS